MNLETNKKEPRMNRVTLVIVYLSAIVAANLSIALIGPEMSVVNAFLFIGLVLTTRDALHDAWGKNRWRNMGLLIAVGAGISYVASVLLADSNLPPDVVAKIALGSCAAFASAEVVDSLSYHALKERGWEWLERSNASNFLAAAVDSVVFVVIAFGWDWQIAFAQFGAKVAGALLWSMVIARYREARAV